MAGGTKRFRFLDGLRGWAAFAVLVYHVFIDALPANAFIADRMLWSKVFVLNGGLAICIFFVVSGFSLSTRYLSTGEVRGLMQIAGGRYLRLAIPIFAICAITYFLMTVGIVGPAPQRPVPLDQYLAFTPSLQGLSDFSLFRVFFAYSNAETYDPPLWTMSYEFFGSFMVLGILGAVRAWPPRTLVFAALFAALMLLQSYFALFIGGVLIADVYGNLGRWPAVHRCGTAFCVCGMILSISLTPWFDGLYIATAMLLVAGVVFCAPIRRLFENQLGDFLGWMSYPLYLVQATVIYAFSVHGLDYLLTQSVDSVSARWIVDAATVPIALAAAVAFCPINDLAIGVSRKCGVGLTALLDRIGRRTAESTRP